MDAFFASIEIARHPELAGKPVIVGGRPDERGVVSTCSYEAREFGVRSAMPLSEAKRRCPDAIFLEGSYSLYREYSEAVIAIFHRLTPLVEVVSIDEAYLDVTAIASSNPIIIAEHLRQTVFEETKLTCSVGIASNKLVAKIASSLAKPNGIYEVPQGKEAIFLAPLPIETIPGVGAKTKVYLNRDGIKTIGDVQRFTMDELINRYGIRGYHFFQEAHGKDLRPVVIEDPPPKSIGAETTFPKDLDDKEELIATLEELLHRCCKRLRGHHMRTKGVTLKLRDSAFQTITRSHGLSSETNRFENIWPTARLLFETSYYRPIPIRLIGISLDRLSSGYWQPTFWD